MLSCLLQNCGKREHREQSQERCYNQNMDINVLLCLLYSANADFLSEHLEDIEDDVAERSLCADLKTIIDRKLPCCGLSSYSADADYDRAKGGMIKSALIKGGITTIQCDLLIHGKGHCNPDNLLCLEMKKSYRKQSEKDSDRDRLMALTSNDSFVIQPPKGHGLVNGYLTGIYYDISKKTHIVIIEIYRDGELINKETGNFDYWVSFKNERKYIRG